MTLPQLKTHFGQIDIPQTLKISKCETVVDLPKMINAHITFLEVNSGRACSMPYYNRLMKVKKLLK